MKRLEYEFRRNGIDVGSGAHKLFSFYEMLIEWNEKMNLTAIIDYEDVITRHFVDSCIPVKHNLIGENSKCIDVGSGAGFPGIPLAIVCKNTEFTLLEARQKRISFLDAVIEKLRLKNCKTITGRAEVIAHEKYCREVFDVSLSRAVSDISTVMEYTLPFTKTGGISIAYRGKEKEIIEIDALSSLGASDYIVINDSINDMQRNLFVVSKQGVTADKYPRGENAIKKKPLYNAHTKK